MPNATPSDSKPAGHASDSTPWVLKPAGFVAFGGAMGIAVVGSVPIQSLLAPAWETAAHVLTGGATGPLRDVGIGMVLSFVAMWCLAGAVLGLGLGEAVDRRRLLALAGVGTLLVTFAGTLAGAVLGHAVNPSLPVALLLGGLAGRAGHARWLVALQHRHRELRDQVNRAARDMKREALEQITRDLRTPVHAMLGVGDLMAETRLDAEQKRHLGAFQRAADNLSRSLEDLEDLARIESGRASLKHKQFSLVPLIHQQIAAIKPFADAKGVPIHLSLSSDLPRMVHGDPVRLGQVIGNLLGQAVKVSRQGSVQLEVRPHSRDPQRVRFAFFDTSLSAESGKLTAVVEPFQGDAGSQRGTSGIAMTLTRRIVEWMDGRLSVRRSTAKGSTVVLSVPLPAAESAGTTQAGNATPAVYGPQARNADGSPLTMTQAAELALDRKLPKVSVLLVDDNISTRHLIESMLDSTRFNVVTCSDGREALQTLEIAPYDVVLMDLDMPGMDGWAAITELRQREQARKGRRTPVVALGTAPFELERQRCLEVGFDQHLCKPLRKSRLLETIVRMAASSPTPASGSTAPAPAAAAAAAAAPRTPPMRYVQRDSLSLLGDDGLIDVRGAVANLGGDATLYLDAIEHLAPALTRWPERFLDTLAKPDIDRARQMATDMQGILEVVGAARAAKAIERMSVLLAGMPDAESKSKCQKEIEQHVRPTMLTLQAAVERIVAMRQQGPSHPQGHNSAF